MKRFTLDVQTEGNNHIVNLSPEINSKLRGMEGDGLLHLFIPGSTAAITTVEFEPGLVKHDLPRTFQQLAPDDAKYEHEATWNDDNGHSHIRAALLGPGLTVPVSGGKLLTGEWQQVVLIDFDTRPRRRKVICTLVT
ncbi:MAG TPA: secondary thiamine-phosphate synthase enzyme YjbQ [Tepidisphaeraceae bacterium]|jgi:secondary thiamine-phosphate synthase enzyme